MLENVATWPLTIVAERFHPARNELPPLARNPRAFAQATWRHLLFGFIMGEIERRFNGPEETEVPPYEHVIVSSNGHGNLEHAVAGGGASD
jgi:hypothetical protein